MSYRVRELRKQKNLSQQALSEASGVSRAIISALESGKEVITTTGTLRKLARALGCSVPDLFDVSV